MRKYNTKPIDFTGCHPVIAEALKRGEVIECLTQDYGGSPHRLSKKWVCSYSKEESCPYITTEGLVWWHAEPISRKTKRIMPPERAIPVLIAKGCAFTKTGWLIGPSCMVGPGMYALMGGDVDGEANKFIWPDCIIEEVEDDE